MQLNQGLRNPVAAFPRGVRAAYVVKHREDLRALPSIELWAVYQYGS